MNREFLVGEYARFLTAAGRAPNTVLTRRRQLERLSRTMDPLSCTEADLLDFLTAHEWKPATRAAERAGLLVLFEWLHAAGHRGDNPAERLPAVRVPPPMPRPAPEDAVALARECAANPHERLMVDLAARAGLRRSEIATLRFSDLIHDGNGDALRVTGKGGRTRVVPIAPDLAEQITGPPRGPRVPRPASRAARVTELGRRGAVSAARAGLLRAHTAAPVRYPCVCRSP